MSGSSFSHRLVPIADLLDLEPYPVDPQYFVTCAIERAQANQELSFGDVDRLFVYAWSGPGRANPALRRAVRRSKLDARLGERWPTIESSLKVNVSKRQIHRLLVEKYRLEVCYSHFAKWCKHRLEKSASASK